MYPFLKRLAVFILGAYTIIAQVVFFREFLVVFLGNELCAGIIFSSWFLGITLGGVAGARGARRRTECEATFTRCVLLLAALPPVLILVIRMVRTILGVGAGEYIPFASLLISTWALITPFSFCAGFAFPVACMLRLGDERRSIANIGSVYVWEAMGGIAGGLLFSFALVERFTAYQILFGGGAVMAIGAFLLSLERRGAAFSRLMGGIVGLVLLIMLFTGAAGRIEKWTVGARWKSVNPGLPLVASMDSRYQNLALAGRADQYDLFGNGQYFCSFPDPYAAAAAVHLIMSEHPDPRTVLLVGGGNFDMLKELLLYPLDRLVYVELDPSLIRISDPFLNAGEREALSHPVVKLYFGDGRRFVKETAERFDVVISNLPDPSTAMLNRFYTREFFEEARHILKNGGVFSTRLSAASDYYGDIVGRYAGSVYATLRSVFPFVLVAPGEENCFFAAFDGDVISSDIKTLQRRFGERRVSTGYFTPYHFLSWWLPERVDFTRRSLETRKEAPLNTDARPVTYYFNLIIWSNFSGSLAGGVLSWFERLPFVWYLLPVALWFLARLIYLGLAGGAGVRTHAIDALFAIGAVGFTAISLEIVLIFALQNTCGYVYRMVGAIVALFMLGLAAGGFYANRGMGRSGAHWPRRLAILQFLSALYVAAIPVIIHRMPAWSSHAEYVFMVLVLGGGFFTGAAFPIANRIYLSYAAGLGMTAGRVNAVDNLGACFGSLLTGVIFVPLLGISDTCLLLAALNMAAALLLLVGRVKGPVL